MASFIELIAKIKQKNGGTFKLVDAHDVECPDGKGLDEILDEKLNINHGAENKDKVMVVDADGNLVPGEAMPKNIYTQKEIDNLLRDKMDKSYTDAEIAESAMLDDCLEGNLKVTKIIGNTLKKDNEILGIEKIHIVTTSKNLFDGKMERGSYDTATGEKKWHSNITITRNSNFIKVHPNATVTGDKIYSFIFYDKTKKYIGYKNGQTVAIPQNCYYINLSLNVNNKTQIEISETPTNYEDYKASEVECTLNTPIYKFGDRCESIDLKNFIITKNIFKRIFYNNNDWSFIEENETHSMFRLEYRKVGLSGFGDLLDCNMFSVIKEIDKTIEYIHIPSNGAYIEINILKSRLTENTGQALAHFLADNNVYIFETQNEKNITLENPELVELLKALKTYSPVTNVFIEGEVKPAVDVKYPQDIAITTRNLKEEIAKLTETSNILNRQLTVTQSAVIETDINNQIGMVKNEQ